METGEGKCSLGYREWTAHTVEVKYGIKIVNALFRSEVNATADDVGLFTRTHVGLQWRLAVELDGEIDDCPAFHQAIGSGVAPSACDVDAHR